MRWAILCVAVIVLCPAAARASLLNARIVSEPGFTRILIEQPKKSVIEIDHQGDELAVSLAPPATRSASSGRGDFVRGVRADHGSLIFTLLDHASTRQIRQGTLRMIDVFAPVETPKPTDDRDHGGEPAGRIAASQLVPGLPPPFGAVLDNPRLRAKPTPLSVPPGSPASPSTASSEASAGRQIAPEPASTDAVPAILIPFSADVGVAALRHANEVIVFFDEPRPLDLSEFRADPVFGRASVAMQSSFTELRLPLPSDRFIALTRRQEGWLLTVSTKQADPDPIEVAPSGPELRFRLHAPGKTLEAIDPDTDALLLVGTDRLAESAVRLRRRSSNAVIDRTEIGVVVEPISDRIELRPAGSGFILSRDDGMSLAVPARDLPRVSTLDLDGLTRSLDLPTGPTTLLWRRLQDELFAAATTPSRARLRPRLAAAQTLLALGMTREARTLAAVAIADDPLAETDPQSKLVRAVAEALCDPQLAPLLADPALPSSDETRLWRGLAGPHDPSMRDEDAAAIRGGIRLLLAYPDHLRDLAAGLAAPILLAHARSSDLQALASLPVTPRTSVPKAIAAARSGRLAEALSRLDLLSKDQDLETSCDAVLASTSLRLAERALSPRAAADALDVSRLECRAGGEEAAALLQEADDRWQAGQASQAFELWRDIERRFPDRAPQARSRMLDSLSQLARPGAADRISAADFVLIMTEATPELAANTPVAAGLAPILADRLESLDLPARATGVLRQVLAATGPGPARARIGARLASALLEQHEPKDAIAVLDTSDAADLPADTERERRLVRAHALESEGDHSGALAALGEDRDGAAQNLRADIDAAGDRWHEAKLVLASLAQDFPRQGVLSRKDEDIAIRLATAASRDGDTALLFGLAHQVVGRFADPDQQDTFDLITAPLTQHASPQSDRLGQSPGSG